MQFYVGFSIHGSNSFVSVNKDFDNAVKPQGPIKLDGITFTPGYSRTTSLNNGIKLLHPDLNENGAPTKNRDKVVEVFKGLIDKGWRLHTANPMYPELTAQSDGTSATPTFFTPVKKKSFVDALLKHLDKMQSPIVIAAQDYNFIREDLITTYGNVFNLTFSAFKQRAMARRILNKYVIDINDYITFTRKTNEVEKTDPPATPDDTSAEGFATKVDE